MQCSVFIPEQEEQLHKTFGKLRCHLEKDELMIFCNTQLEADIIQNILGPQIIALASAHFGHSIHLQTIQKTEKEPQRQKTGHLLGMEPLRKDMTFDTFVGGQANKEAFTSAVRIASMKDANTSMARMLYIYGDLGLGKTHLLHATVNDLVEHGKNVLFYNAADFVDYLVAATQQLGGSYIDKMRQFHEADALAIDDITFIQTEKMPRVTVELKHLLDHYLAAGKFVLFTGERYPTDPEWQIIPEIATRLLEGLVTKLDYPDRDLRYAILKKTFATMETDVDEHIIGYLADGEFMDIRNLKQAVQKLVANAAIGIPITIPAATAVLAEMKVHGRTAEDEEVTRAIENLGKGILLQQLRGIKLNKETRLMRNQLIRELVQKTTIRQVTIARALQISPQLVATVIHKKEEPSGTG